MLRSYTNMVVAVFIVISLVGCSNENSPSGANDDNQIASVSFVKSDQLFNPASVFQIATGDFDNDGDLDAVFAIMGSVSSRVLLNDGTGHFTYTDQYLTQQGHGVVVNDFDSDGDLDLFITCAHYGSQAGPLSRKPSKIYFNDGTGLFTDSGQDLGDTNDSGNGVYLVDIDNDGDMDVHVYYYDAVLNGFYHKIYQNNGAGIFSESSVTFPDRTELYWSDLDSDNDTDVFIRDWNGSLKVMLNDGAGNFIDHWQQATTNSVEGYTAFGDLDNDGDIDAITSNGSLTQHFPTLVFLNNGSGSFTQTDQELPESSIGSIEIGDLNGDNTLDFLLSNYNSGSRIMLNNGNAHFTNSGIIIGENETNSRCAFGDFNGDGKLDIFLSVFGEGAGRSSLWFNQ